MFRIRTLYKMAIVIVLICLCLMTASLWAQVVNIQEVPLSKKGISKLEGVLSELTEIAKVKGVNRALQFIQKRKIPIINNKIRIIVESSGSAKDLQISGAKVEAIHRNLAQILVPLKDIAAIAALPYINFVRLPSLPIPHVVSEGLTDIGANEWHYANYKGHGIKVAILDCEGFAGYLGLIGSELPTENMLVVRSCRADNNLETGSHGTACAEIVHDMAPDATLYLVNYDTEVEMGEAVSWLISEGVDIITHSCGWITIGPYDGTGPMCEIVNNAYDNEIFWTNSIGNQANRHWEGFFTDTADSDGMHEFNQSPVDETIAVSAGIGMYIVVGLSWNDWGPAGSTNDYDLYLYRQVHRKLNMVAASETRQNGSGPPAEVIIYNVNIPGTYHIVIRNHNAVGPNHLELYSFNHDLQYKVPESSMCIPSDASGAMAIGAAFWSNKLLEPFSSWGPPDIPGGGPPDYSLIKPDILAPDAVSTFTYGQSYGTSASCPHVAGAAALLLSSQLYSDYTPGDLREVFINYATNYGYGTLPDIKHGHGFITMPPVPSIECTDLDEDTYNIEGGACGPVDCNDSNPEINPGVSEVCDGVDNNCDNQIDEGCSTCTGSGDPCTINEDCCSNNCRGKPGRRTCK